MNTPISAKELRASLPKVVAEVRRGVRFTVLYRSRPAFQIVPVSGSAEAVTELEGDSLYRAKPVGRSKDGRASTDHDSILHGK
jgi:antitoxin (DNA-binding transcriptional repressor) of toxin-antitoxin stability system